MRDHSKHIEVSRAEGVATLLEHCAFTPGVEEISLEQAFGRTLAVDATAQITMPNCLTCNMDSIALHWSDFEGLDGGIPDISQWKRGVEWQFANTGVAMPEGFDTAIVIENAVVSKDDTTLEQIILPPSRQYAGTSSEGSRMRKGDPVAPAGTLITPLIAAALGAAGYTTVPVMAKPRVAFIPTGNELVAMGEEIGKGKNIETNSLVIRGKVEAWGGECKVWPIVRDNPQAIEAALREAAASCDIIVLNAGSSKGSDDWGMEVLEEIGEVLYHETNHGPGHHSSGSVVDGVPVVGISGPPLGAAFTTDFYLKPLINYWFGKSPEPQTVTARLAAEFPAGGPGSKPGNGKPSGEDRPSVVQEGKPFFAIQHLELRYGDDGVLEAIPIPFRPNLVKANTSGAYYALNRSEKLPAPGDLIEVELRG